MEQVLQTFLDFLKSEYRYSENTVAAYRNDLTQFYFFLHNGRFQPVLEDWSEVKPEISNEYVSDLKHRTKPYAPSSIARKVAAVKSFFNYLHARSLVAENPTENIDSPKVEKRLPKTLAAKEIGELLEAPARGNTPKHLRDIALLNMLYATGMRVSEVVFLQMDDVDMERGILRVKIREGESLSREVPLDDQIHVILQVYLADGRPYLVKNPNETALFLTIVGSSLPAKGCG